MIFVFAILFRDANGFTGCAHLDSRGLPLNRCLARVDISDDVWKAATRLDASGASMFARMWCHTGKAASTPGDQWTAGRAFALLFVPAESTILVNPLHPGAAKIAAAKIRKRLYDLRMR